MLSMRTSLKIFKAKAARLLILFSIDEWTMVDHP
jgi:hypothetical protein